MSCHSRRGDTPLLHRSIPLRVGFIRARLRVFVGSDVTGSVNVWHVRAELLIDEDTLLVHHRDGTTLGQGHDGGGSGADQYQLAGDHLLVVCNYSNDGADSSYNAERLRTRIDFHSQVANVRQHDF